MQYIDDWAIDQEMRRDVMDIINPPDFPDITLPEPCKHNVLWYCQQCHSEAADESPDTAAAYLDRVLSEEEEAFKDWPAPR